VNEKAKSLDYFLVEEPFPFLKSRKHLRNLRPGYGKPLSRNNIKRRKIVKKRRTRNIFAISIYSLYVTIV
jgi:hypothetical protein